MSSLQTKVQLEGTFADIGQCLLSLPPLRSILDASAVPDLCWLKTTSFTGAQLRHLQHSGARLGLRWSWHTNI